MTKALFRLLGSAALTTVVSACASVTPYDSDFSCKSTDYGQCIHPDGAYALAVANTGADVETSGAEGEPVNRRQRRTRNREERRDDVGTQQQPALIPISTVNTPYEGYQQAVYREMSGMIDQPVTPMLTQPKVVRTLIMPYSDESTTGALYMPRFVYSILEGPQFVIGDYLSEQKQDNASRIARGQFALPRAEAPEASGTPEDLR